MYRWPDNDGDGLVDCDDPDCSSESACQTSTYTFDADIQPLLVDYGCGGCHHSSGALVTYSTLLSRISVGDAAGSTLYQRVAGTSGQRMPTTGNYMNSDEIAMIEEWINAGAPEN